MSGTGQARNFSRISGIVAANLKAAREERGLTQRELGVKVGGKTDGQRISDWERAINKPNDLNLVTLADILGHDLAWFYSMHPGIEYAESAEAVA